MVQLTDPQRGRIGRKDLWSSRWPMNFARGMAAHHGSTNGSAIFGVGSNIPGNQNIGDAASFEFVHHLERKLGAQAVRPRASPPRQNAGTSPVPAGSDGRASGRGAL